MAEHKVEPKPASDQELANAVRKLVVAASYREENRTEWSAWYQRDISLLAARIHGAEAILRQVADLPYHGQPPERGNLIMAARAWFAARK